uniref:SH3GL interacting endocytic adaptor 1 n=1 Tax=Scleropages formosus TaxID=113540 RepID=A0A8C9V332_SCLFO
MMQKAFGIRKKERDTDSTGSPDKDGGVSVTLPNSRSIRLHVLTLFAQPQKRTNGAPNGFHGEIDWERYNSPEVDDEGYNPPTPRVKHFYSSSESEEEEDHRRKFKIKIKPLAEDSAHCTVPSVDELKASIGNIALSPSPLVSCCSCCVVPMMLTASSASTWSPPPLPPKNVPSVPPACASPNPDLTGKISKKVSLTDLDNIFGPVKPPKSAEDSADSKWVSFKSPPTVTPGPVSGSAKPPGNVPPPLVLNEDDKRGCETLPLKDDLPESTASPKEFGPSPRATPPPPPPPTYRAVVSSPGPCSGTGSGSGSSSPARPATPLAASSPTPPPPPPRPSSRPKLPPGKPSIGDVARPFSPPVNSSSPPPFAPLARAESTSSISSTNSLSAATTPTVGCSRGPSPLTMGAQDTLPVAAAFTETVNAYFKGADPSKCVVKITGEMVLSFPAGITRHFANNPSPAILTFSITNYNRLEHVLPNPQLLCCDTTQPNASSKEFWVNMPNLMTHLKKVAEQKPQATYYNVDMLKYQVSTNGIQSTPLNLAVSWRCDSASTDLRIDYKYNSEAMTTPVALNNVQFLVPVDGGVTKVQAMLPPAAWNAEQQRILWKIPDISQKSDNGGVGSLLGRFQLTEGPSKPSPLAVQFTSEGSTLSGCDIELVGAGYRFSLVKRRFTAGKYLAEN